MKKKISKIAIIGHFGGKKKFLDGQTVKTKILYQELIEATNFKIMKVDTYYKSHRPIKLLLDTFIALFRYKNIIVLLSDNGRKFYFPLLSFFAKHFGKNIYHDVIGGNLHTYVEKNKKFIKYLNSFRYNWVETNLLKSKLESFGINNCEVIPNFKRLKINKKLNRKNNTNTFKLCTFSRVMKEKGITDAINSVVKLNRDTNLKLSLDIYGPIDKSYQESFDNLLKKHARFVKYCGTVPFDESVDTLKKYDILLFPTFWQSEGFPGTIVDALSAGLPVVATDWNCNSEIIKNYITGIVYPNDKEKTLDDAIIRICNDNILFNEMCVNAIKEAEKYTPKKYINKIINYISEN